MPKTRAPSLKVASLFDIRLTNLEHDVLVLKGGEVDAPSALLQGKIVLLLKEPLAIKKLSLRLYATIRLNWNDTITTANGTVINRPLKFEKKIYEYSWDNVDISHYLDNLYDNATKSSVSIGSNATNSPALLRLSSAVSMKSLGNAFRGKSSANLTALTSPGLSTSLSSSAHASTTHTLVQGNYLFPFSAVLPGDMPESVEGLPGASQLYRLEATFDRGKFHGNMSTKKHIRVIRTMASDAVELSELVSVDNTWPKKVEYSLNVPAKAIAIGSGTPINCMFVPLAKGLRLGKITILLQEVYSYIGYIPPVHSGERIISQREIPAPQDDDPCFSLDRWEVNSFLRMPTSLLKVCQDCDIQQHIKVRHKIKFNIGLINPDGHVLELRASLPVQLFISPFVPVSGRPEEQVYDLDPDAARHAQPVPGQESEDLEEPVFSAINGGASATSLANEGVASSGSSYASLLGLMAPPLYEKHRNDRLWLDASPGESPLISAALTPADLSYANMASDLYFPLGAHDSSEQNGIDAQLLNYNLAELSRRQEEPAPASGQRATFNLGGARDGDELAPTETEARPQASRSHSAFPPHLATPQVLTPPNHLSRANSTFKLDALTLVPTYTQAIRSGTNDELLAPVYKPPMPGLSVNLAEVNRRFEELTANAAHLNSNTRHTRNLSRGSSFVNIRGLTGSKTSSANSSPSHSREVSSNNLQTLLSSARRPGHGSAPNSTSNSRNGSFMNLQGDLVASGATSPTPMLRNSSVSSQTSVNALTIPNGAASGRPTSAAMGRTSSTAERGSQPVASLLSPNTLGINLQNLSFMAHKKASR